MVHIRKADLIKIFEDTQKLYENNETLRQAVTCSKEQQMVIDAKEKVCLNNPIFRYKDPAQILVSKKSSFEAAKAHKGKKVCVLNFASATSPGGGVTMGSNTQEEILCRCSTLYPCLSDSTVVEKFYSKHIKALESGDMNPLYNDDCIYTPGILVFKSDSNIPVLMPEKEWYTVDVISCAAPNLRAKPSNTMNPYSGKKAARLSSDALLDLYIKRVQRILDVAVLKREEVVILGAFGCGAFQNPPTIVAEAMARAAEKYNHAFEIIEFAVYCTLYDLTHYDIFKKRFDVQFL